MAEVYVGRLRSTPGSAGVRKQANSMFEHTVWPYVLAIPAMAVIGAYVQGKKLLLGRAPETNFSLVDGISINSRRMKDGAAKWPALNTCYNFSEGEGATALARKVDRWWMNIRNAQAVRNRLKIAKFELRKAIDAFTNRDQPVRILSLAAGTAQGVIEVAAEYKARGVDTEIMLVDQDASALRYARDLAHRHGVEIRAIEGNVLFFNHVIGDFKADIVEMMGLVDYLKDGLAHALIRKIRLYLDTGGYFFTCHIHWNAEAYFLKHVVDWSMLYRTRDQLEDLLVKAGFLDPQLITEPHGIHSVAVACKH